MEETAGQAYEVPVGATLFVLGGVRAGKTITLKKKYVFVDGKMYLPERLITQGTERMLNGLGAKMYTHVPGAKPRPVGDPRGGGMLPPENVQAPVVDAEDGQPASKNEKLERVVKTGLDPDVEEHWRTDGKPKLDAVVALYGASDVNRDDIDEVAPGWTRETARAAWDTNRGE